MKRALAALSAVAVFAVGLAGSGVSRSQATPALCAGAAPVSVQHVVWIFMENKGYNSIIGSGQAPNINSLATKCGLATNFHGEMHPSLPNYIAATSGGTQGITTDEPPAVNQRNVNSIFQQTGDWRSLEESMPSNCNLTLQGSYAVKHNPAAYYTPIRPTCGSRDVPLGSTPDISAKFTLVTPNQCDDMHSCSVQQGDTWLNGFMGKITSTPQYRTGNTVVFITWDENDGPSHVAGNQVATLVVAPSVMPGTRSGTSYTHYSMLRTTEELLNLPLLGSATGANSMRVPFHL